jgi:UDP-N-acetylmuramoyl-tripeptide--D-alanyl-D-alanine ligase
MEKRTLEFVARACAGEQRGGSPAADVLRVCTDSRQAKGGDLFIALEGDRFDGHHYLHEVARSGAIGVVVRRDKLPTGMNGCAVIAVGNTRQALGQIAAAYRRGFVLPVIAVGGSNGKTTTKDLIASVLREKLATHASESSFNNDVGVPLTLLGLERRHQAAVIEVGTNHPGELEPLVRMAAPNYGVITSIGREHLEFFQDIDGVIREEGWLAELLPAGGKLYINGDDDGCRRISERAPAEIVRLGWGERNHWRASRPRLDRQGVAFRVEGPDSACGGEYRVNLLGRHQVTNALFAIALGRELGLSREEIARGLAACKPAKMRLQYWDWNGVRVLDDAYNANADSMIVALRTLLELPCKGRRVAVLGDMAELGAHSEGAHEEVGRHAAELGVGQLFAIGTMAAALARGARGAGLSRVLEFASVEPAAAAIRSFVKPGDLLLLKASRATRLERVAELLRAPENPGKNG